MNEHSARVAAIQGEATRHVLGCFECHREVPEDPFYLCPTLFRILDQIEGVNADARRWDFD